MIPDGALLVNTARGSIIDEDALAEELATGRFKAILDVYEVEPLPEHSKLRGLKNAILIPHMGGPTIDRRRYVTLELIEDIKGFLQNRTLKYEIRKSYAFHMSS
jgi:phosphoglycerate dehydrogenase-like enzyme